MSPETAFAWADEAVGFIVREIRPDLAFSWRGVVPADLGIRADDWLKMSQRMIERFNMNCDPGISMSEADRRGFRKKRFIIFAVAIADLAV
jgi:hypothetical protein